MENKIVIHHYKLLYSHLSIAWVIYFLLQSTGTTILFPIALITLHTQREQGKVFDVGIHMYMYTYMFVNQKKFESQSTHIFKHSW